MKAGIGNQNRGGRFKIGYMNRGKKCGTLRKEEEKDEEGKAKECTTLEKYI